MSNRGRLWLLGIVVGCLFSVTLSDVQAQSVPVGVYRAEVPRSQPYPGNRNFVNWQWSHTNDAVSWSAHPSLMAEVRQAIAEWEGRFPAMRWDDLNANSGGDVHFDAAACVSSLGNTSDTGPRAG